MIKEIRFINWKSFRDAKVYIDPLNVLIGTNASGKSNIIDGIAFLNSAVQGRNLQAALDGERGLFLDGSISAIRGGAEYAALFPGDQFTLEAVIQEDNNIDYKYSITVRIKPQVEVVAELLIKIMKKGKKPREKICLVPIEIMRAMNFQVQLYLHLSIKVRGDQLVKT
jgi:Predicted ATPase